jgi:hypothetical protein
VTDPNRLKQARDAVRPMAERLAIAERNEAFQPQRWTATRNGLPVLHLEDVSAIPFVSMVPGVEEYQHRARVRAGEGDVFAAVTPEAEGYAGYCRDHLGLGDSRFLLADPGEHGYAVATSCLDGEVFRRIAAIAKSAGGLVIHPYMSIAPVWELALRIAERERVPVEVIGPPPPVLWLANDKQRLTEIVESVLGENWVVETHASADPREMVRHLIRVAEHHGRVGLKRTRCASAMGNAVYDLEAISRLDPEQIEAEVHRFLKRTEWAVDEEVLIVAWETTDVSPSTQVWIPPDGCGPPVVEGVYEQLLEGAEKIFLGSRPSLLDERINEALVSASARVATALQSLGYAGRCSFDFIVVGRGAEAKIRFVECNGRWGGTSTPMHLVDRLFPDERPFYRAQDFMDRELVGVPFPEVLRRVGDGLYDPATSRGRFVFYNVGPLDGCGKLDVIALGESPEETDEALTVELPRRLGLRTTG